MFPQQNVTLFDLGIMFYCYENVISIYKQYMLLEDVVVLNL